jgi:hypothetical protein
VNIESIGCELKLSEVYDGVNFPAAAMETDEEMDR